MQPTTTREKKQGVEIKREEPGVSVAVQIQIYAAEQSVHAAEEQAEQRKLTMPAAIRIV